MRPRTAINRYRAFTACVAVGLAATVLAHAPEPRSNADVIASLPANVEMVLAADDLTTQRETPPGRALEHFASELTDWSRTTQAWDRLADALRMSREDTIRNLLGRHVLVAATTAPAGREGLEFAVISSIRPTVERKLRERLGYVPRAISSGVPIFTIEGGTFEAATLPGFGEGESAWPRLVLSPHGDFFDSVLNTLEQRDTTATLGQTPEWPRVREMLGNDLFVLLREPAKPSAQPGKPAEKPPFFALSAEVSAAGLSARFIASSPMLLRGFEVAAADPGVWPTDAVNALSPGTTLFLAGFPELQGVPDKSTLMVNVLSRLQLPASMRSNINGATIIAFTTPADHPGDSGSIVIALPLRDVTSHIGAGDSWASWAATGKAVDEAAPGEQSAVRQRTLAAGGPTVLSQLLKPDADFAWCYAASPLIADSNPSGWMVIAARCGSGEAAAATVRRTAGLLTHKESRDESTLFRLIVRPVPLSSLLSPLSVGSPAGLAPGNRPSDTADLFEASRWLTSVESSIVRADAGLVSGTIVVGLNLELLAKVEAAAAGGQAPR